MTNGDSRGPASSRSRSTKRSGLALAGLAACCGAIFGGCGSDSTSGGQPFPEFEGRWIVDTDASALACPQTMSLENREFSLWSGGAGLPGMILGSVTIEAGVLTDLVETTSTCMFGFNVDGKVAKVPNSDPFTGKASICPIPVNNDGSSVVLSPSATQPLTFQLDKPVAGVAQKAFITGSAAAAVTLVDIQSGLLVLIPPCTFVASVGLHKFAKP